MHKKPPNIIVVLTDDPPLLFDLNTDIAERLDIASENPEIVENIQQIIQRHQQSLI